MRQYLLLYVVELLPVKVYGDYTCPPPPTPSYISQCTRSWDVDASATKSWCYIAKTTIKPSRTIGAPVSASVSPCFQPELLSNISYGISSSRSRPNTCWYIGTAWLHPPIETSVAVCRGSQVTYFLHQQSTRCSDVTPVAITLLATLEPTKSENPIQSTVDQSAMHESWIQETKEEGCHISGCCEIMHASAELLYFPISSISRDMCGVSPTGVPKYRSKIFDSPVPSYVDGRNKTFYADYAYISIKTLVAWTTSTSSGSLVNQAITAEGGLLSLRSQDLSSLRYATSSGFLVFQTHAFNFADLQDPVPFSAWQLDVPDFGKASWVGYDGYMSARPTYLPDMNIWFNDEEPFEASQLSTLSPFLSMPTQVSNLDSRLVNCRMDKSAMLWDPPLVLPLATGPVVGPTLSAPNGERRTPTPGQAVPGSTIYDSPSATLVPWSANGYPGILPATMPTPVGRSQNPAEITISSVVLKPNQPPTTLADGRTVGADQHGLTFELPNGRKVSLPYSNLGTTDLEGTLIISVDEIGNFIALNSPAPGEPLSLEAFGTGRQYPAPVDLDSMSIKPVENTVTLDDGRAIIPSDSTSGGALRPSSNIMKGVRTGTASRKRLGRELIVILVTVICFAIAVG